MHKHLDFILGVTGVLNAWMFKGRAPRIKIIIFTPFLQIKPYFLHPVTIFCTCRIHLRKDSSDNLYVLLLRHMAFCALKIGLHGCFFSLGRRLINSEKRCVKNVIIFASFLRNCYKYTLAGNQPNKLTK